MNYPIRPATALPAIVELELGKNPFDGELYVFINRHRNRLKCLQWESTGFILYYKVLAEEKFKWPKRGDEVITVTGQQINWLLDGYDLEKMKGHKKLHYDSVF
jgi:transposase